MNNIGYTKIKVVGVGGGGSNAVSKMYNNRIRGVEYITVNTDYQDLNDSQTPVRLMVGKSGMGVGGDPKMGRMCFEKNSDEISKLLHGCNLVFIAAGMGGGTGTGGASVVAKIAKELDALVVGVVTTPFSFEGVKRKNNADWGIKELKTIVDTLVTVPNDKLLQSTANEATQNPFRKTDEVLNLCVKSISEMILEAGNINIDFADIKTIIGESGSARMSLGNGYGLYKAQQALESAINNPLLEESIVGATRVIFNVTGGEDMTLSEVHDISTTLASLTSKNCEIIFGTKIDPMMEDEIYLTLIAAGFPNDQKDPKPKDRKRSMGILVNNQLVVTPSFVPTSGVA